ncbi:MAG: phosphatase PAP2 family protein [Chitinophagaceae bacterium]|nr:phosphatase PAP2 family protein [Chitinophagaceae bacterium]
MRDSSVRQRINRLIVVLAILAVFLLLIVITVVFIVKDKSFDAALFSFASDHTSPAITRIMRMISFLGKHSFLIPANILLILLFSIIKEKWWAIRVTVVSITSLGVMSLLKNLFRRIRPDDPLVDGITNYGFPSGHSTMAIAFYGLLAGWVAVMVENKLYRRSIIAFLILLVLMIGYSRIYLRVHYATDVLAGFCVGTIWLTFCLWLVKLFSNKSKRSLLVRNL